MKEWFVRRLMVFVGCVSVLLVFPPHGRTVEGEQMKMPPPREIPGLTAEDKFPRGCVDCHINMPDKNKDERISTLMSGWNKKVQPKLREKAQAAAPAGVTLKGVHPVVSGSSKNIPAGCNPCHGKKSKMAPPFAALLHSLHLTGGENNEFLGMFGGECTHCHKMNTATGVWSMPSGPEK